MEMDYYFYAEVSTLLASIFFLGLCLSWFIRHKSYWRAFIAVFSYLIHAVILYGLYVLASLRGVYLSQLLGVPHISEVWSAILRLQGIVTIGITPYLIINCHRLHRHE